MDNKENENKNQKDINTLPEEKKNLPEEKKAEKKVKMLPGKKLPKLFKKEYTKEAFEKKILSRLFIEPDRLFVEKLFEPAKDAKGRDIVKADVTKTYPKADLERYKSLASQIKAQKPGIKIVPLIAVVVLIAGIGIGFTLFKNVIIKKAIVSSMQNIFQAKTDVGRVDFKFFESYLNVENIQQANKDSPMKNLFQMDLVKVDFNLTDLCRGKFHAENIAVEGVALNTDRTTSGELPKSALKKTDEESKNDDTAKNLKEEAQKKLLAMFEDYNPEKMINDLQNDLKSPEVAKEIADEVQTKIAKWEKVPSELEKEVKAFSKDVDSLVKTNWGKINDVARLKDALEKINNATKNGKKLKESVEKTSSDIKKDAELVTGFQRKIEVAVKSDISLVENKITDLRRLFSPEGLKDIMNEGIQSTLYEILGKYSPYLNKALDSAMGIKEQGLESLKTESDENDTLADNIKNKAIDAVIASQEKKKNKKPEEKIERLPGRMVYYKADKVPTLLIDTAIASGYEYGTDNLLFRGVASDVSNNQDLCGKPATIEAEFNISGRPNNAKIVVDARKDSRAPLVSGEYFGKEWPIQGDASVFTFKSKSDIKAILTADADGSFKISGNVDMITDGLNGMTFEPARVCELYKNALSGIRALSIGFTLDYDAKGGTSISIDNMDKLASQLVTPITAAITSELNNIAADAKTNVTKMLSEKTGIASDKIEQFTNIQGLVNNQKSQMDSLQKQLDNKRKELERQIKNTGTNAAKNAATDALKKLGL